MISCNRSHRTPVSLFLWNHQGNPWHWGIGFQNLAMFSGSSEEVPKKEGNMFLVRETQCQLLSVWPGGMWVWQQAQWLSQAIGGGWNKGKTQGFHRQWLGIIILTHIHPFTQRPFSGQGQDRGQELGLLIPSLAWVRQNTLSQSFTVPWEKTQGLAEARVEKSAPGLSSSYLQWVSKPS